jgi:hypothetical protein
MNIAPTMKIISKTNSFDVKQPCSPYSHDLQLQGNDGDIDDATGKVMVTEFVCEDDGDAD